MDGPAKSTKEFFEELCPLCLKLFRKRRRCWCGRCHKKICARQQKRVEVAAGCKGYPGFSDEYITEADCIARLMGIRPKNNKSKTELEKKARFIS